MRYSEKRVVSIFIGLVALICLSSILGYSYRSIHPELKNNDNQKSQSSSVAPYENQKSSVPTTSSNVSDENTLVINEWGLRMKMRDASKVQYKYLDLGQQKNFMNAGTFQTLIEMSIKPEFLEDKSCNGASVSLYQLNTYDVDSGWTAKKIDNKYYVITGSPYSCDGGAKTPDNLLGKRVLDDFKIENLSSL